jgi:hypothetical protein
MRIAILHVLAKILNIQFKIDGLPYGAHLSGGHSTYRERSEGHTFPSLPR